MGIEIQASSYHTSMNRIYTHPFLARLAGFEELMLEAIQRYQARQKLMRKSPIHGHILIRKSFVEVSGGLMRCIPRANGAIYIEGHAI